MTVLYLSFGHDDYHLQTVHSIRSLRRTGYDGEILVHTDRPSWFASRPTLSRLCFKLDSVDTADIAAQCANGYIYKYKLALLRHKVLDQYACVLLTDSDTLFLKNPQPILDSIIKQKMVWVYENEGCVAEGSQELQAYYERYGADFSADWPSIMPIYNSGLVGVGEHDVYWLDHAIELCDALYRDHAGVNTFEQIALSAALWAAGRTPSVGFDFINHYYIFKSRMLRGLRLYERLGIRAKWLIPEKLSFGDIRDGNAYLQRFAGRHQRLTIVALRLGLLSFRVMAQRERQLQQVVARP